ncbi:hypothetical protein AXG89_37815 [Burkholderia sp. PAMC 26561]|nr:hypothetical protein AXG89_37815 [Burkholderia sp. PAMC 26561]
MKATSFSRKGAVDRVEHVLVAKRLRQEIHCAGFHRPHRHFDVAVTRHGLHLDAQAVSHQVDLKRQATFLPQAYIEDQAARDVRLRAVKTLARAWLFTIMHNLFANQRRHASMHAIHVSVNDEGVPETEFAVAANQTHRLEVRDHDAALQMLSIELLRGRERP